MQKLLLSEIENLKCSANEKHTIYKTSYKTAQRLQKRSIYKKNQNLAINLKLH